MSPNNVGAHTGGAKTQLLREFFRDNPEASSKEGAEAVGTSWAYASQVKHHGYFMHGGKPNPEAHRAPKPIERQRGFSSGKKGDKAARLREFFAENPDATVKDAVQKFGGSASYTSAIKHHGAGNRSRKAKRDTVARVPSNRVANQFPVNASANGAESYRSTPKASGAKPLEVAIGVPDDGVQIRFDRRGRVIGTLIANETHLQFVRAHGRKGSLRSTISWDRMAALFESGIL
jgi:hypothetical protein